VHATTRTLIHCVHLPQAACTGCANTSIMQLQCMGHRTLHTASVKCAQLHSTPVAAR
jgi:hypothetical protein